MARDEGIFEVTNVDLQLYVVHFGNIHQWQPQVADGKKKSKRQRETGTTKHLYSCVWWNGVLCTLIFRKV